MITVSFDDTTAGPDDLPSLRIADAANRIHGMDARLLPGLLESSWLDWAPPSSRLPDVDAPSPPGRDDWLWARGHAGLLGFDVSAYGSGMMFASMLAKRAGVRRAGWSALALAWCARMARLDARAWTLALLEHDPARVQADSLRLVPVSPLSGLWGVWASPAFMPGVTGPDVACALMDCARGGRYRSDHVVAPDGRTVRIPDMVWDRVDSMGLASVFADTGF
ncbi:Uncharacterised protein [Bifidobacterium longum subsp. infantis]|uniref:Uncharacterized protein n=2 Tax=Bifidobacterium longum TaxID=216816 RepID=A0A564VN53_BIFLI|nr:hypothetical protein [Bifidobacterium longum]VUX33868.1 Uncharacterised protein [Bifidobacterium longum subsp. infantis]